MPRIRNACPKILHKNFLSTFCALLVVQCICVRVCSYPMSNYCTGYLVANIVESVVHGEARITRFRNMKVTAFILIVRVRMWWKLCVRSMPVPWKNVGSMTMSLIFCPTRKSRSTVCINSWALLYNIRQNIYIKIICRLLDRKCIFFLSSNGNYNCINNFFVTRY